MAKDNVPYFEPLHLAAQSSPKGRCCFDKRGASTFNQANYEWLFDAGWAERKLAQVTKELKAPPKRKPGRSMGG